MAWIDYKKAFDNVPYKGILKVLNILKISSVIIQYIKYNMEWWQTNLSLIHEKDMLKTNNLNIKRGIFQGDLLSPLLSFFLHNTGTFLHRT